MVAVTATRFYSGIQSARLPPSTVSFQRALESIFSSYEPSGLEMDSRVRGHDGKLFPAPVKPLVPYHDALAAGLFEAVAELGRFGPAAAADLRSEAQGRAEIRITLGDQHQRLVA
jgi:hypothetical protein